MQDHNLLLLVLIQILSGDVVVIRGLPRGGPPPTRTVALSNVTAPRLARRANPNIEGSSDTVDEVSCQSALGRGRGSLVST